MFSHNKLFHDRLIKNSWIYKKNVTVYLRVITEISQDPLIVQDSLLLVDCAEHFADAQKAIMYVRTIKTKKTWQNLIVAIPSADTDTKSVMTGLLSAVNATNENLQFYLNVNKSWNHIINIKNAEKALAIPLDPTTKESYEWDLEGITISDIIGDWMPHSGTVGDCKEAEQCKAVVGIVPDILKPLEKRLNITFNHYYEPVNWGLKPLNGKCTKTFV